MIRRLRFIYLNRKLVCFLERLPYFICCYSM
uniref:Uncharacterized protein n=1 Tax=Heterorhabditis bacteriophora TaxID=37862 RepID=A0A1I7WGW2_HETBA